MVVVSGRDNVFFMVVSPKERFSLWPCSRSLVFVYNLEVWKHPLVQKMVLQKIKYQPLSFSTGHGYLQHSHPEWDNSYSLKYHIYFILRCGLLWDKIFLAYKKSLQFGTTLSVTRAVYAAVKFTGTHGAVHEKVRDENFEDGSEMRNTFITLEIPGPCALRHLVVPSASSFWLYTSSGLVYNLEISKKALA